MIRTLRGPSATKLLVELVPYFQDMYIMHNAHAMHASCMPRWPTRRAGCMHVCNMYSERQL